MLLDKPGNDPVLFSERQRRRQRDEREATGENFWTADFADSVRRKVLYAAQDAAARRTNVKWQTIEGEAKDIILRNYGWEHLRVQPENSAAWTSSLTQYMMGADTVRFLDAIEAMHHALKVYTSGSDKFADKVRTILREDRVSFDFIDGFMIPFESRELHVAVVIPTLTLLSGRPLYSAAESSYLKALEEITRGDAGDAITDAGRALQETLEALGCEGSVLGDLIKSARKKDLLGPHDAPMTDSILGLYRWAAADRNAWGDAHKTRELAIEDAWLTVHVVGALILRLADGPMRGLAGQQDE